MDLGFIVPGSDWSLDWLRKELKRKYPVSWPLGIEMEYENVRYLPTGDILAQTNWEAVADGSLRNNGREFRMARPAIGEGVLDAVEELCSWARELNFAPSARCGFHIHMDVRPLNTDQLCRAGALWALIEERVFAIYPRSRVYGNFCIPWFFAEAASLPVWRLKTQANFTGIEALLDGVDKYTSLNFGPLRRCGSIEFRVPPATTSMEQMLEAANLCVALMHSAVELSDDEVAGMTPHAALAFMSRTVPDAASILQRMADAPLLDVDVEDTREILVERCLGKVYNAGSWESPTTKYLSNAIRIRAGVVEEPVPEVVPEAVPENRPARNRVYHVPPPTEDRPLGEIYREVMQARDTAQRAAPTRRPLELGTAIWPNDAWGPDWPATRNDDNTGGNR